ncbi:MAG TPA: UDP-N-acetylmuramate dehydrogenase [Gammaproteobacteria bacterium]|nr:UDP-N-acetylmuramate dehydrogenase [Gammaproteobacteria bacterium]
MNAEAHRMDGLRGELRHDEPMARHTTWRVGGPAECMYTPADLEDLVAFLRGLPPGEEIHWVGLGSNLLVRDGGIRGTVIMTHGALDTLERLDETTVRAGAGVACAKLAKQCVRWQLHGADFFAGIPGTVGGALAMNAGAWGGETWPHVVEVRTIDREGRVRTRRPDEYRIGYRTVVPPAEEWFIEGTFRFQPATGKGRDTIKELLARRNATQPIGLPSCGSVFRNPPGDHAARLIEAAGLKGRRIGGAYVSEKHANFIINGGDATAADIEDLIVLVADTVAQRFGVHLHPEVRILGERSFVRRD